LGITCSTTVVPATLLLNASSATWIMARTRRLVLSDHTTLSISLAVTVVALLRGTVKLVEAVKEPNVAVTVGDAPVSSA
jgi:hypothetical protein